ncbi:LPS-assembly protein LptD [Pararhizobium mangrovi]|uniref:LPS-assembly protein LptD n=2 Tax=Pararhizobium mangrovi TaxID=2590452 RepID=A0A506UCD6_9HYPH|nr:LPS-assembly protein LptD [Pararhizobium mangrovi]
MVCGLAGSVATNAQQLPSTTSVPPGTQLLLSSKKLSYNENTHTVVASGQVQIAYDGYRLVANRVEYNQDTGRVRAAGEVALVNPDGTKLYADNLDVTDNFADGFVNGLRIDTPQKTHIVATSAERRGGVQTQFNNGVYTACKPCEENPDRAPFWQIRARKIVQDSEAQTVRLRNATFDLFGLPVGYFPYLSVTTAKRKSGILRPSLGYDDALGFSVSVPYFQVLSPYSDATLTVTGYTKQGFLADTEYRRRFRNGSLGFRAAGIGQFSPKEFETGSADYGKTGRFLFATQGSFDINPRWKTGWNVFYETDENFGRTYAIPGYNSSTVTSQAYLTGIDGKNYFDLHAYRFDEQGSEKSSEIGVKNLEKSQPFVLPVIDYSRVSDEPVFGGQLSFNANETSIYRSQAARTNTNDDGFSRYRGLEGNTHRLSGELEWKRTQTFDNGLLLTPILAARGDAFDINMDDPTPSTSGVNPAIDEFEDGTRFRTMVTAGLEASYPFVATAAHSSHVIEPIAQLFVRPNEDDPGSFPNEDAQSFVFDTTNLFDRDKFSGYDRVEGGTRANVGVRYTGSFDNGVTLDGVFGQSYQIAGQNSFDSPDLVYAGHDSGLDHTVSDYVGSLGVSLPVGIDLSSQARFDNSSFALQRTDVNATYANRILSTGITYAQLAPQPEYGSTNTAQEVSANARLKFAQNWSVYGKATYDIERKGVSNDLAGLIFNNECFTFNIFYKETRDLGQPGNLLDDGETDWSVGATLSFRTLGDIKLGSEDLTTN